jgi:hypothetical protein
MESALLRKGNDDYQVSAGNYSVMEIPSGLVVGGERRSVIFFGSFGPEGMSAKPKS